MLRPIRLIALALVAALGGLWGYAWITRSPGQGLAEAFAARLAGVFGSAAQAPAGIGGIQLPQGVSLGGPFRLVDQTGRTVTEQDYAPKWLLIYFGYTFCPDVCPTELATIAAATDALGAAGENVIPIFISIDPDRDKPAQLADYVPRFHPRLQGLTGSAEQLAEVARRFRVYYARTNRADSTDYLMDHSSFIYLVGPEGRVRSLFRPGTRPEDIAAAIAGQLARPAGSAS
jgi:protein SCO1/2